MRLRWIAAALVGGGDHRGGGSGRRAGAQRRAQPTAGEQLYRARRPAARYGPDLARLCPVRWRPPGPAARRRLRRLRGRAAARSSVALPSPAAATAGRGQRRHRPIRWASASSSSTEYQKFNQDTTRFETGFERDTVGMHDRRRLSVPQRADPRRRLHLRPRVRRLRRRGRRLRSQLVRHPGLRQRHADRQHVRRRGGRLHPQGLQLRSPGAIVLAHRQRGRLDPRATPTATSARSASTPATTSCSARSRWAPDSASCIARPPWTTSGNPGRTGLELAYDNQNIQSLTPPPGVYGSWRHQHRRGRGHSAGDRGVRPRVPRRPAERAVPLRRRIPQNRRFLFQTDPPDRDYFNLGVGVSMVLPKGMQPFLNFRELLGYKTAAATRSRSACAYRFDMGGPRARCLRWGGLEGPPKPP